MPTTTIASQETHNLMQTDNYWQAGRVVVHASGEGAGSMRLDMDLPGVGSAEEAQRAVKMAIPGELSPLDAIDAVGENGRFVMSFFSSDVANAGHLPADAIVSWHSSGGKKHTQSVGVVAAEKVEQQEGEEAANVPGGKSMGMYPKTVGLLVVVAVLLLLACVVAFLAID